MNGDVQDAKLVLREVRLMRYLSAHRKIITIKDLSYDEEHDHLYIYMELLDSDLHRVIQSKQVLSDEHNRYFMYQILRALRYMHKQNIIHRDLYVDYWVILHFLPFAIVSHYNRYLIFSF